MIRPILTTLAFIGVMAGPGLLATAQAGPNDYNVFVPPEAHDLADQRAAIGYARQLIAAGQMDTAVSYLAEFVASHPNGTEAARFLGDLYYRQGRFDRAQAVYEALLARNPHDKETHNR